MASKDALREKYKSLRNALKQDDIDSLSLEIANQILALNIWNFEFYHIFLTIQNLKEVNTDYILNILAGKDKNIVISKSNFNSKTLENYLLTDATKIKLNKYNIPEPVNGIAIANKQIDVVLVPLLAFDQNGNRIGYGKGFYDNFLATCKPETIKIGLSFFEAEEASFPLLSTDVSLDYCVTPKRTYVF